MIRNPAPELCLLASVVQMVLRDLQRRLQQAEAVALLESLEWDGA